LLLLGALATACPTQETTFFGALQVTRPRYASLASSRLAEG
jgi:hypothetical protein